MEKPKLDSIYLENLDEFINDEKKIVTYKWLSLTLGVHANVAKQMLYHFVTEQRKAAQDKGDLYVVYMVSGVVEDHGLDVHRVVLVREENLEALKSKMKNVLSVHVYSVQNSKTADLSVLYSSHYKTSKENIHLLSRFSSISCPFAETRIADLPHLEQENISQNPPKSIKIQDTQKSSSTISKKQGGLTSFLSKGFPNTKRKTPDSPLKSRSDSNSPVTSSFPKKEKSPLGKFLLSSPSSTVSKESITPSSQAEVSVSESDPSPSIKEKPKLQSKAKPRNVKRSTTERNDAENPLPKRKRIMQLSDSESSSDEETEEDKESPFPPSPLLDTHEDSSEEVPVCSKPEVENLQNSKDIRMKRRKLVSKTFMDDDGYFVTKKVYEQVSDSEEEIPQSNDSGDHSSVVEQKSSEKLSPRKNVPGSPKRKPAASLPIKGKTSKESGKIKQSSIMSFFSRK